jgi:hypothetical protein
MDNKEIIEHKIIAILNNLKYITDELTEREFWNDLKEYMRSKRFEE